MLKKLLKHLPSRRHHAVVDPSTHHHTIPRNQHGISRKQLSENALKVLYRLQKAGFQAYLVGGCVRDALLGLAPKDFDVATDAHPEQVNKLFGNSRIIGRRFRIVHVRFGREIIEVTTFRANPPIHGLGEKNNQSAVQSQEGMLLRDNVYGSIEEDAQRRDFTVNALYYTTEGFSIHDYTNGIKDLKKKTLRIIGDPATRYKEDPVRILRAIRFSAKLGFTLEKKTAAPIPQLASMLTAIPAARLFDESLKLFLGGYAEKTFALLDQHDLLQYLFPEAAASFNNNPSAKKLISLAMANTDRRIQQNKPVTPAFIYASLLWPALLQRAETLENKGMSFIQAKQNAGQLVLISQQASTSVPRRFSSMAREIWDLQWRLPLRHGKRSFATLSHQRFRAAYDFLLLREQSGEKLEQLGDWWTEFQHANESKQSQMINTLPKSKKTRRRKPKPPKQQHKDNS